jgi:hypothetical protein
MKYVEARELVPVAVSLEPFQVRMVPLAEMPERSRPMFPEEVTVPVRPLFPATEVTVPPEEETRQVPFTMTQPPVNWMPLAKVEEALVAVTLRALAWRPFVNVVVPAFVNLFKPPKVLLSPSKVEEAAPARELMKPESLTSWLVASFCQKAAEPFVVKTVEEAPIEERPVPPRLTANVPFQIGVKVWVSPADVI